MYIHLYVLKAYSCKMKYWKHKCGGLAQEVGLIGVAFLLLSLSVKWASA